MPEEIITIATKHKKSRDMCIASFNLGLVEGMSKPTLQADSLWRKPTCIAHKHISPRHRKRHDGAYDGAQLFAAERAGRGERPNQSGGTRGGAETNAEETASASSREEEKMSPRCWHAEINRHSR